jgi:hypothetical protein
MTTLAHRPDLKELLDAPAPDQPTLAGNLRDIRRVNRALGFACEHRWESWEVSLGVVS